MRRKLTVLLAVAVLLSCCAAVFAADIFVATNGNDTTGNGSISNPYATLTKATTVAVAGDTIQVRAGAYVQHLYWDVGGDGAPGAYITIQAYDGDLTASFVGDSGAANTIDLESRHYIKVIGLDVAGTQSQGYYCVKASVCQYVEIKRCALHDSGSGDVVKGNQGDYYTIEDNEIYRPGGDNPSGNNQGIDAGVDVDYGVFRNNYIHDFPDMAYYSKGGSEYVIAEGNIVTNQDPAWPGPAVGFGQQTDSKYMDGAVCQSYNMVMRNNLFADCPGGAAGTYSCYHGYFYNNVTRNCGTASANLAIICQRDTGRGPTNTDGFYVFNNVFLDTRGQMPAVYKYHSGDYTDWQHDYNNFYNNGSPIPPGSWAGFNPNLEAHSTFGNPNLANQTGTATTYAGWKDCFRITAASALLIDKGSGSAGNDPQPAVHTDMDGTPRPQGAGWDIGAFEYASGPTPPIANFTGTPTSGAAPLTVAFTDTSVGSPTSWSWTFGDGGTSTAQNPSHVYNSAGSFTVSLTATNAQGSDGETKTNYITAVQAQDYTCASLTVNTGTLKSGDHTSVHASDNVYLVIGSAKVSNKQTAQVSYTMNTGLGSLSLLTVTVEGKVSAGTQPLTVYAYNYSTSSWTSIATGTLTTTDSSVNPTVSNPSQYISGGTVQVRVKAGGSGSTAFDHSTDLVKITAAP